MALTFKNSCKNERMSLEKYADRFRLQHPKIQEQYYRRLAKLEIISNHEG